MLAACAPTGGNFSPFNPPPDSRTETEPAVHSPTGSGAVIKDASGSTTIAERLLPSGVLEVGAHDAPLTMLLVTNLSCRYCHDFDARHLPRLLRDFIETGKLRYQLMILPLVRYPESMRETSALFCAATEGKGWLAAEWLFANTEHTAGAIRTMTKKLKLTEKNFTTCMDDPKTQKILTQQESLFDSLSIRLVPTMFLNGERSQGVPEYPDLRGRIERMLKNM